MIILNLLLSALDQRLQVPFLVARELRIVQVDSMKPASAGQKLFVMHGDTPTAQVRSFNDLEKRVRITTTAGALAYVRLRTAPMTARFFQNPVRQIEPLDRRAMVGLSYGSTDEMKMANLRTTGEWGLVDGRTMHRLRLRPVTCVPVKGGYLVERTLVDLTTQKLQFVRELVGTTGKYSVLLVGKAKPSNVGFSIPVEE